ncbi:MULTISPECIES: HAD-IB family hydrolase [Caballeronia]|uniref:HAD-IB family hydrolase n=1 Tax=Caballeronia TaxID=1827195 RepID=UPI001FD35A7F|nr:MULTISPECIES: HAD-IB family hydrolase [Caballeronia]MDR5799229.1 HAD-IB family hydrolase [Caballeronia sp. LZ001]
MPSDQTVAAFDFDGTITTQDSLKSFIRHTVGRTRFALAVAAALPWLIGVPLGLTDRGSAKARFLRHALHGVSVGALQSAAERFCSTRLLEIVRPEMLVRIRDHQSLGHTVVIVSASPSLYLEIWARTHDIDTVLSTELEIGERGFSGRLLSANCWGPEKVRRLTRWWNSMPPSTLYVYGDSRGDRDMAAIATFAWIRGERQLPALANWTQTSR